MRGGYEHLKIGKINTSAFQNPPQYAIMKTMLAHISFTVSGYRENTRRKV